MEKEQEKPSISQRVTNFKNVIHKVHNRLFKDASMQDMQKKLQTLITDDKDEISGSTFLDRIKQCGLTNEILSASRQSTRFNEHLYHDVEFFERFVNTTVETKGKTSVFDAVNKCQTAGGSHVAKEIYLHPSADIDMLKKRTDYLKQIQGIYQMQRNEIDALLLTMRNNEKHVAWLYEEKEDNLNELYELVFFRLKGLQPLNRSASALTAYNWYRIFVSPIFGIVAPIMYFLIPYVVILYRFKINLPFKIYLKTVFYSIFNSEETILGSGKSYKYIRMMSYLFSAVFYFQGIFSSIDLAKTVHKMSNLLISHLSCATEYVKAAHKLSNILWDDGKISSYININQIFKNHEKQCEVESSYVASLDVPSFSVLSNFGKQLKTYKCIDLNIIKSIVSKSFVLDALLGAVKFVTHNDCTVCTYAKGNKPLIQFQQMGHPSIQSSKAVLNDFNLGIEGEANAIITSPNSSGKSILIKSIIINVLMAQTMGITSTRYAHLTPFNFINTQINVPDSTGHESLFEAEMHRCKYNLDVLKNINVSNDDNKLSLIVMDEIFNSTNPIEAVAGAYAVCKKLSSYSTNMLIFTTHFNYLTKLAKDKKHQFVNYRMQTDVSQGVISFTYKLEKGVNKHLLALELLRMSGFDDEILEEAISIKESLVKKVESKKPKTTTSSNVDAVGLNQEN